MTGAKRSIADWAKGKGRENWQNNQYGNGGMAPCCFGCAKAIVLKGIRVKLGLQDCKLCFTGAAPIARKTLELFATLDIPVMELFGQSECTGPACTNFDGMWKMGSIGVELQGTNMQIHKIVDGVSSGKEVRVREEETKRRE